LWEHPGVQTAQEYVNCTRNAKNSTFAGFPHTATHCNTLQLEKYCKRGSFGVICVPNAKNSMGAEFSHTATDCNRLQQTATDCNRLQHAAIHCNCKNPANVDFLVLSALGTAKNSTFAGFVVLW